MKYFFLAILVFLLAGTPALAASWPASDQDGTSIGGTLMAADSTFEPSGIVWHSGRNQLVLVGDEGQVATMDANGTNVTVWKLGSGYDLEDVTIADSSTNLVYLLDENTSSAFEFDLTNGSLTGKSWSFADKLSEVSGAGTEGLAWVEGSFYVGWQYDGDIYVYSANLGTSQSQQFVQEIHMTSGYTDISGLAYDADTEMIYALYDGLNLLEERSVDGELMATYSVPGYDQEGITLITSCSSGTATVGIAEDSGRVMSYGGYPLTCQSPVEEPTYLSYEISGDGVDNDGDGIIDEYNTLSENGAHPDYQTLDPYDTSLAKTALVGFSGLTNGDILVTLGDSSMYAYDAVSISAPRTYTNVRRVNSTAFVVTWVGRYAAVVNGYTGEIVATTTFARGNIHPLIWARSVLGL